MGSPRWRIRIRAIFAANRDPAGLSTQRADRRSVIALLFILVRIGVVFRAIDSSTWCRPAAVLAIAARPLEAARKSRRAIMAVLGSGSRSEPQLFATADCDGGRLGSSAAALV